MTDSEQELWSRLRLKQVLGVQFYRQKPIGDYIVDFYAPKARLVVEVDGSQHLEAGHAERDAQRDAYLASLGFRVLRFSNLQVLQELETVVAVIFQVVSGNVAGNPPNPPLRKGG
jgi:very-short-patch-repair endonuclease